MIRAALVVIALLFGVAPALAQGCGPSNPNCIVPTAPNGTNNNQAASTAFVQATIGAALPLANANLFVGNASNIAAAHAMSGDCTISNVGAITCTKTNGVSFAPSATTDATNATNITSGNLAIARFNSGTGATSTSFWRGDGTWVTPPGTGTVTSVTCGTGLSGGTFTTSGTCAASLSNANNILSGDVVLNNTANYFDGPSMAQGTAGTWFASGTVTLVDTGAAAQIFCKLWDATTVIASGDTTVQATAPATLSLSGTLATPAANIRISCRDSTNTTGKILFNQTGNSKDSSIFGFRIQ